jgi:ATP-dependent RNA helicase DeaD
MELPSTESINTNRINRFLQRITDTLAEEELGFFNQIIEQYRQEHNVPAIEIASALAKMAQGKTPLLLSDKARRIPDDFEDKPPRRRGQSKKSRSVNPDIGMERYRIEVGKQHDTKPGNIVGAIANEAGIDSDFIGRIKIYDTYSTVDLPEGIPDDLLRHLKKIRVSGEKINLSKMTDFSAVKPNKHTKGRKKKKKKRK